MIDKDSRAGLYITVIFHLTVIIILMVAGIDKGLQKEESFVLDFSKYEELERLQKEVEFKEEISRKLQEKLEGIPSRSSEIRNYAVDGSSLSDDRNSREEAEKLYKEAERLAAELKNGQKSAIEENAVDETVELPHSGLKDDSKKKEYSGPSVLRYELEGRKASHLKIPAYRCYSGGEVTVIIKVNRQGTVTYAKVQDEVSSSDKCLRDFAVRAARMSKFSVSMTAPTSQMGEIVYQFIAQ